MIFKTPILAALVLSLGACASTKHTPDIPSTTAPSLAGKRFREMTVAEKYAALKIAADQVAQPAGTLQFEFLPGFSDQIAKASRTSSKFWAESTNYDEFAKKIILTEEAVQKLGIPHRKKGELQITSAGVMHTYGYLFSTLVTPYGLKSKRWVESKLDERLGFKAGLLSPDPSSGEFLANLTWILDFVTQQPRGCKILRDASTELCTLGPQTPTTRSLGYLEQEIRLSKKEKPVRVRTHFIPLLPATPEADSHLLAYEVVQNGKRKWVTAFPIQESYLKQLVLDQTLAPAKEAPFKARFNLYLDAAPEATVRNLGFVRSH